MWTAFAGTWTRFSKRNKYNKRIVFPEVNRSLSSRQGAVHGWACDPFCSLIVVQNELQGLPAGGLPDFFPAAGEEKAAGKGLPGIAVADEHQAYGVSEFISAGACKAGDGYGDVCLDGFPGTFCHGLRHRGGDGPHRIQQVLVHTQQIVLDPVGVADNAALVDGGAAGDGGQRGANAAAGAALGGCQGFARQGFQHLTAEARHGRPP